MVLRRRLGGDAVIFILPMQRDGLPAYDHGLAIRICQHKGVGQVVQVVVQVGHPSLPYVTMHQPVMVVDKHVGMLAGCPNVDAWVAIAAYFLQDAQVALLEALVYGVGILWNGGWLHSEREVDRLGTLNS